MMSILSAAALAPSGSNSQPWRLEVGPGDEIEVYMLPEKDHPVLNYRSRGTLVANGALLENLTVAAAHHGFDAKIETLPRAHDNLVARVHLSHGARTASPDLWDAVHTRATNRKAYRLDAISPELKDRFVNVPKEIGAAEISVKLTEDRGEVKALAIAASANEEVMLGDEKLHRLFVDEIVWTEEVERERKSGLYLKTMELKPPQEMALKFFKSWSVMNFFNKVGAARGIAKSNAKEYMKCPMYGAVICRDEDRDYVDAGRVVERIWLLATAAGLSMHLQTGTNFLYQALMADKEVLTPEHAELVKGQYAVIANIFGAGGRQVPITFRIGYDGEPSARSSKKASEVKFK